MPDSKDTEEHSPPIPFTEYLTMLCNTQDIQISLRYLVSLFAKHYFLGGSGSNKMMAFNNAMKELKVLDLQVEKALRSDIHEQGLTVNLGA